MSLKVGSRLRAQASSCEVIVVKGTDVDDVLICAGADMAVGGGGANGASQASEGPTVQIGKRYVEEQTGIEVLCTKAGIGPLTFQGRELIVKAAKQLPASD